MDLLSSIQNSAACRYKFHCHTSLDGWYDMLCSSQAPQALSVYNEHFSRVYTELGVIPKLCCAVCFHAVPCRAVCPSLLNMCRKLQIGNTTFCSCNRRLWLLKALMASTSLIPARCAEPQTLLQINLIFGVQHHSHHSGEAGRLATAALLQQVQEESYNK